MPPTWSPQSGPRSTKGQSLDGGQGVPAVPAQRKARREYEKPRQHTRADRTMINLSANRCPMFPEAALGIRRQTLYNCLANIEEVLGPVALTDQIGEPPCTPGACARVSAPKPLTMTCSPGPGRASLKFRMGPRAAGAKSTR
ncbi:hypothetical protein GCM10010470_30650 [Saccharopolyspora taberi]|uniref:Uncharacterized protein n=1 Tax=Saccharopolyspora taberi TaxID=60895 RepID=A0ABN3VDX9_9PSEU